MENFGFIPTFSQENKLQRFITPFYERAKFINEVAKYFPDTAFSDLLLFLTKETISSNLP